jgi:hypothetical protein
MFLKSTFIVALAIAVPQAALADEIVPPAVPAKLSVPEGNTPFSIAHAAGTQNYVCLPSGKQAKWTFFGPQATLFNDSSEQIMTHFLSPNPAESSAPRATWQDSRDTSAVWAVIKEESDDPEFVESGAIKWLLLRVVGAEYGPDWGNRLTDTTFIQRVNTSGGVAPTAGCAAPADVGKKAFVPYTTDYVFYR